ncbi:hypothetical protein J1N35_010447 [Gossypium stocksii]|uniref:JAB1/MPN/MOV34 metalloenzyme domain-containing protein n=1 Tax=Gossypium stocksii TaxID=47602 RepID=A0A9D4AC21_9ROSI|nr:hypothetical protein J1N35_010447 [Gossypium stocksii]
MARSFLQVAATEEVILKIIKHCKEFSPTLVTGQLLGLDVGSVLEVTNYFPFPIHEGDEEIEPDRANYQLEMMRYLMEVNVGNNTVGCAGDDVGIVLESTSFFAEQGGQSGNKVYGFEALLFGRGQAKLMVDLRN